MGSAESSRAAVERAAFGVERPLRRLIGSARADPLPHAGTISIFLLIVVTISGLYITLFYEFGFEASYESVEAMEDHVIQRVARAVHRYSSAALVLTTVVHGWRIFVAGRFAGGRARRWLTGLSSLVLVWLAGVTGYLLLWDVRAQALVEAVERLIGGTGWGAAFVVRNLLGSGAGSGAGLTVAIWFLHLGLTAAIAWFVWRHVRRTRLAWLPPSHWMIFMGGALLVISAVLPVGVLDPTDGSRLVPDMPLDPFVLFLLPPLLGDNAAWVLIGATLVVVAVAAVPYLLRDRHEARITIDEEACTGCELCVPDCPYLALAMEDRPEAARAGAVAVVELEACVGCGICLGSCSFGAIELPGYESPAAVEVAGRDVVVACRIHARHVDQAASAAALIEVPCTGALNPQLVGDLERRGADTVQIVGCAPADCTYGIGNRITEERVAGERAPQLPRASRRIIRTDWVAVGDLDKAAREPGAHPHADGSRLPLDRRPRLVAAAVVALSLVAVAVATLAPFDGHEDEAGIRVIVDHESGARLAGQAVPTGGEGPVEVLVVIDGVEVERTTVPTAAGVAVGVVDIELPVGEIALRVDLLDGEATTVLHVAPVALDAGRRLVIEARDAPPPPTASEGERIFESSRKGACGVCHSIEPADDGVGPSLAGVATRAAITVDGLDAADYLRESILDPDAFVVDGYPPGQMLPIYEDRLSEREIDALVEYLLTLEEPR